MSNELASVPLEARHIENGGKMVPFAGFNMPIQYTGIKQEHLAVRNTSARRRYLSDRASRLHLRRGHGFTRCRRYQ